MSIRLMTRRMATKRLIQQFDNGIGGTRRRQFPVQNNSTDSPSNFVDPNLSKAIKFHTPSGQVTQRPFVPRRALMYVPGDSEKKQGKITSLNVDSVVLDCEDGVAVSRKNEARDRIRQILDTKCINFGRSECTVRVNSVDSGFAEDDLQCILESPNLPNTILLPKVDFVDHLHWFVETTNRILKTHKSKQKLNLILFIESAQGMLALPEICKTAWQLSVKSHFVPDALVFGSDDYLANIGAARMPNAQNLTYARQYFVMVAKAFRLQAIDIVYIDYKDQVGFNQQCIEGAQMGFTGKQIIHPSQVQIAQESFSPSVEKVEWARKLLETFEKATDVGAISFEGQMIDMPLVLQAKNILVLNSLIGN